jgi:hypothetical protein
MKGFLLCVVALLGLATLRDPGDRSQAKPTEVPAPPPSGLRELWVIPHRSLPAAEQVLAQTLQGVVGRTRPRIWLRTRGFNAVVEEQLRRDGVRLREAGSVWELLTEFRREARGAILYRLGTPGLNVATSLCGPMNAVAIDESLQDRAKSAGLRVLLDVREMDEREALATYRSRFARGLVVEQSLEKPGHLRDFAVAHRAFTYATTDAGFRTDLVRSFGPQALVYGWGDDEFRWVSSLSRANASGVPADWCVNLSALEKLPGGPLRRPRRPQIRVEDARVVAFVMSDGDNIQWLCGDFVHDLSYWASPLRGAFPMTWEVSPLLAQVAPRLLQHLYATAKETDGFVSGPGAPGYTFPHLQPDRAGLARQAAPLFRRADLSIASVLNSNDGHPRETIPLLELPGLDGVIYKEYSPYHRRRGEILWHRGKPCVSYRFVLWEGLMGPEDVAREVSAMPAAPDTDPGSYALINLHAWSFRASGGPMEAVRRTISLLPPGTRVVTADQLIGLLKANLGERAGRATRAR